MKSQPLPSTPRQLPMALESSCLHEMSIEQREITVALLARLLLEASGHLDEDLDREESDDEDS